MTSGFKDVALNSIIINILSVLSWNHSSFYHDDLQMMYLIDDIRFYLNSFLVKILISLVIRNPDNTLIIKNNGKTSPFRFQMYNQNLTKNKNFGVRSSPTFRQLRGGVERGFGFHQACWALPAPRGEKYVIGHHNRGWKGCLTYGNENICLFGFLKTRDLLQLPRRFSEENVPYVKQRPANHTVANLESSVQKALYFYYYHYYYYLNQGQHLWAFTCTNKQSGQKKKRKKKLRVQQFCSNCEKQSLFSFVSGPSDQKRHWRSNYRRDCPTGIEKLSAWGLGLRDTYGPMHYPGMRSLWQSPANFHQHLALPSPPLYPGPPTWLPFLPSPSTNPPLNIPGCWPLTEAGQRGDKAISSTQSRKVEVCNHFFVFHQTVTDCSRGQALLTLAPLIYLDLWTSPD